MKSFKFLHILSLTILVVATGCSKNFENYSKNGNQPLPGQVPPGIILRSVLNNIVVFPGGNEDKQCQYICSNYTYYGTNEYWTGSATLNYGDLNNVIAMEAEARRIVGSDNNPYHALGLFLRAFFFVSMSEKVGDLPMTQALQGVTNTAPKYDTQKDIFKQALLWLDSANTLLAGQLPLLNVAPGYFEFSGDFYYKERLNNALSTYGALTEWQKVVNSYKLRVLIELSKKAATDPDMNIPQQFAAILNDPAKYPVFTANTDNLQYVYNSTYNYYPDNINNLGNNQLRLNLAATLETTLGRLNDLRCMVLGEPARGLQDKDTTINGKDTTLVGFDKSYTDTSYKTYVGAPSGEDLSTMAAQIQKKRLSLYNRNHFYSGFTAEPTYILSYPEVCFAIAEAINRGWVPGDAGLWYMNGVKAQFAFYGIVDGANIVTLQGSSGEITYPVTFNFADYFAQDTINYKGNNTQGLNQILLQKYLAYARNSGYQAFYQWRRTGVPAFDAGPGTGNGGVIPRRFQYPSNEITSNGTNYAAALQSQFGGKDDINTDIWLVK